MIYEEFLLLRRWWQRRWRVFSLCGMDLIEWAGGRFITPSTAMMHIDIYHFEQGADGVWDEEEEVDY